MPILLIAAAALVILVLRIVYGLFTSPGSTLAMLGSWVLIYFGFMALVASGVSFYSWTQDDGNAALFALAIAALVATFVFFSAAAWLKRVRRRSELRREYRLHNQAAIQAELRTQR